MTMSAPSGIAKLSSSYVSYRPPDSRLDLRGDVEDGSETVEVDDKDSELLDGYCVESDSGDDQPAAVNRSRFLDLPLGHCLADATGGVSMTVLA